MDLPSVHARRRKDRLAFIRRKARVPKRIIWDHFGAGYISKERKDWALLCVDSLIRLAGKAP